MKKAGLGFVEVENAGAVAADTAENGKIMHPLLAFLPLIVVVVVLAIIGLDVVIAIFVGNVVAIIIGWKPLSKKGLVSIINTGAAGSMQSTIATSAVVGFGSVIKAVPAFTQLTDTMVGIGGSPLIAVALSINVLCGATGSASGGLGIALEALSERFAEMSASSGIPMAVFHRIASLSSGGLDSLPHNGGVVTCLSVCGLTHKESYLDICMTSVVIPIITTVIAVILSSAGLTF